MSNGFKKWDQGKPKFSMLPWKSLEEVCAVVEYGAAKYGHENWQLCEEPGRYLDAALRHLIEVAQGNMLDEESGRHHLAHAATNCLFLLGILNGPSEPPK